MIEARGWGLPESHLLPDAVVAYVDGELSLGAQDRASAHITRCPSCAGEVASQRQARAEVKGADAPAMSAGFLASLRSIPQHTELNTAPDNLAITEDGQLVAIQRPDRVAGLRGGALGSAPLGSTAPLGNSPHVLGGSRFGVARRRAAQGAGVVVSGLVLSALALVVTDGGDVPRDAGQDPLSGVLPAQFGAALQPSGPPSAVPSPAPSSDAPVNGEPAVPSDNTLVTK